MPHQAVAAMRASVFPTDERGIGGPGGRQPEGYWFKLAGRRESAMAFARTSGLAGDERPAHMIALAWFADPAGATPTACQSAWLGFEIPWSWAIGALDRIYPAFGADLALVSDDGRFGFAVDTYVGYLPWEYDDGETVYRVARWYPSAAAAQLRG